MAKPLPLAKVAEGCSLLLRCSKVLRWEKDAMRNILHRVSQRLYITPTQLALLRKLHATYSEVIASKKGQ